MNFKSQASFEKNEAAVRDLKKLFLEKSISSEQLFQSLKSMGYGTSRSIDLVDLWNFELEVHNPLLTGHKHLGR